MPITLPNEITDIPNKKKRQELTRLMAERSVLAYAFSWERLHKVFCTMLADGNTPPEDIVGIANTRLRHCVAAFDEKTERELKEKINEAILNIYTENGIEKTIRHTDPFGRPIDYIILEGTSSSFNKEKALQWAVAHGIPAKTFNDMYEYNTSKSKYVTISTRVVKEAKEEE